MSGAVRPCTLRQLHWLPVQRPARLQYNVARLVHHSLSGQACMQTVVTIISSLVSYGGRRLLLAVSENACVVPSTSSSFNGRNFNVAGPRVTSVDTGGGAGRPQYDRVMGIAEIRAEQIGGGEVCPWTPLGDFRPADPCAPLPPNPGYATAARVVRVAIVFA